jgi:hypothetical protein
VCPLPRSRSLNCRINSNFDRHLKKGGHIVFPGLPIEINRQKRTGLVCQKWINTGNVTALEMIFDNLVGHRTECLIRTLTTLYPGFSQTPCTHSFPQAGTYPFVCFFWFRENLGNTSSRPRKRERNKAILSSLDLGDSTPSVKTSSDEPGTISDDNSFRSSANCDARTRLSASISARRASSALIF